MKRTLQTTILAVILAFTMLTASALPILAPVAGSAGELTAEDAAALAGTVTEEYAPTADEYENLQYGEVVAWEGYEGFEAGASVSADSVVFFNSEGSSGVTGMIKLSGTVSEDADAGVKYVTTAGGQYRTISGTNAKAGTYTVVMRARAGAASSTTVYIRGKGPKASDPTTTEDKNWKSQKFTLTNEFTEYALSYDYTPSNEGWLNQVLVLAGDGIEVDTYALYYKPFDNYERPQYGELVAWEGYETRTIGSSANGTAAVYNSNTSSGVTGIGFPSGTVQAESPTGNRYIVTAATVYYPSIAPNVTQGNVQAKAGVYTHVVRARKGTGTKMTLGIRTKELNSATNTWKDAWGTSKAFTLTDEFVEYSISYNYIPSDTLHIKDLCFQCSAGIEIDSFALYYKPFEYEPETINKVSIRTTADKYQGMRFAAFVDNEKRDVAVEYGYIVSRGDFFASADEYSTKLVFDADMNETGTNAEGILYVSGKSYLTSAVGEAPTVDKVFATTGESFGMDATGTYFTAVLYNISDYEAVLVARPYLKISDGTVYYGTPVAKSINEVAEALVNEYYEGDATLAPEYIQTILGTNA